MASVDPEFGTTLEPRQNRGRVSVELQSNLYITTEFGTAEARRLNWDAVKFCEMLRIYFQSDPEAEILKRENYSFVC